MSGSRVSGVTNAAIDALGADGTLTTLLGTSKVYSFVPEDTAAPYVVVLGGREDPWVESTSDVSGRAVDVEVVAVSTYRGTKQVDEIIDQCLTTLTADAAWSSLTEYAGVLFVVNERPTMELVDGRIWYQRRATVRVFLG